MSLSQTQLEIIMEFTEGRNYYAVETLRGHFLCRCNDPLLEARICIPPKVVIALRHLLLIDRDYALETLKAILHK